MLITITKRKSAQNSFVEVFVDSYAKIVDSLSEGLSCAYHDAKRLTLSRDV